MVDTQQPAALTIIGIALGISTLFVIFRICARIIDLKDGRSWDTYIIWSDVLLGIAYLLVAAETYVIIRYTIYTWQGYHLADIPKLGIAQQVRGQKYNLANQLLYNPILSLVKGSVILFLLHIVGTKTWVRRALWTVFVINFMLAVAIFIADAFQCSPFKYVFDYPAMDAAAQKAAGADSKGKLNGVTIKGGKCFDQIKFFLISAGLAVATDLLVVGIPIFIVWDLKMARRKKIIVSCILGVGLIVTGVSVARLVIYSWRFSPRNHDRTYGVGYTVSSLEANLAIATGCVPSFGSLVRRISPRILGSTNYASRPTPSGYLQQSGDRKSRGYALQTVSTNKNEWEGPRCRVGAWSSDENILAGPEEIRKEVNVEVTYGEAVSVDDARQPGKHSF